MNENLLTWDFQGYEVRTLNIDGAPWWVLADVCKVLEICNASQLAQRLDDDEKGIYSVYTPYGEQDVIIVNEYGLYEVLFRSDKPKAKPFRKWVTHEVLPTLRATGRYIMPEADNGDPAPTMTTRAYAYLDMAKIVSRCRTERLPLVLDLLKEGGWKIPEQIEAKGNAEERQAENLAEKIERVRMKHDLTYMALAKLLGIPREYLCRYVKKVHMPRIGMYCKLIDRLDELYEMDNLQE